MSKSSAKKKPAAQVGMARKAAAMKAANQTRRGHDANSGVKNNAAPKSLSKSCLPKEPSREPWRTAGLRTEKSDPEDTDGDAAAIRLLSKPEVMDRTGATFPTLWSWMRAGTFPRARIVVGKSMWLESEVNAWIAALPIRLYKGETEDAA